MAVYFSWISVTKASTMLYDDHISSDRMSFDPRVGALSPLQQPRASNVAELV